MNLMARWRAVNSTICGIYIYKEYNMSKRDYEDGFIKGAVSINNDRNWSGSGGRMSLREAREKIPLNPRDRTV